MGIVSVLRAEVKYGPSPRDFPRANPEENPEGSGHIALDVIYATFEIMAKN